MYRTADGKFYVVSSQSYNEEINRGKDITVLKVTQYSSKWKKLKTAKVTSKELELGSEYDVVSNADFSTNSGNCSITMREGELYILMSCYQAKQKKFGRIAFKVNCNDMEIKEVMYEAGSPMQQEAIFKDEGLYQLWYYTKGSIMVGIENYPDMWAERSITNVVQKDRKNYGIVSMEVGNENILVCGTSGYGTDYKDVELLVVDRKTGEEKQKWLTSYIKKKVTVDVSDTRMVKLSEDRYAILYSTTNTKGKETMHYVVVNNAGKKIYSTSYTGMHFTGASEPILYNGNLVWMEGERCNYKNGKPYDKAVLYQIPAIYEEESNVGKAFTYKNNTYKITSKSTVAYTGTKDKKGTKIEIPATVSYGGQTYKVTSIADKALQKNKKIKTVVIGSNIKEIGKYAFSDCSNLTTIEVKSKSVKKIGKNAFKGIKSNATIKAPKAMLTSYKKLFKGKGQSSKVKWKKYKEIRGHDI